MLSKSAQVGRYGRKKLKKVDAPESDLQGFVDEYLDMCQIEYIRVPNTTSSRVIRKALCGIPDNTAMIPISDDYSLCLHLELKTKSQLHGKQLNMARNLPLKIAQTPEAAQGIIDRFRADAGRYKGILAKMDSAASQGPQEGI